MLPGKHSPRRHGVAVGAGAPIRDYAPWQSATHMRPGDRQYGTVWIDQEGVCRSGHAPLPELRYADLPTDPCSPVLCLVTIPAPRRLAVRWRHCR